MTLGMLALKTLLADRGKLAAALVGVVFSVVLVNVQGGLFLGLIGKAGMLVDHSQAEIWVGHKHMHNVDFPRDIPRRWLHRVQAVPGVAIAEPYLMGFAEMTLPSGNYENVMVIGVPPNSALGQPWNVSTESISLNRTDAIYVDSCDGDKLEEPQVGELREIGGRRARIVGQTQGLLSFLVSPYVFASYDHALTLLNKDARLCSYFLVKLQPQANAKEVCEAIMQRTPELDALPAEEYSRLSQRFWLTRSGIGISFGAATGMGLLVGLVMVAQTLYASVLDRVSEFAALKAMGASDAQIFALLTVQSIFMAIMGTLLGLACVMLLHGAMNSSRAPIEIPFWLSMASFLLVLMICLVAALLPYQRVRSVDPLSVLQGS